MRGKCFIILLILFVCNSCNSNERLIFIDSVSMYPSIHLGDCVLEDSSIKAFDYGDIVSYYYKGDESLPPCLNVYRIVGLPGDSIAVYDYITTINGKRNQHKFLDWKNVHQEYGITLPNGVSFKIAYREVYRIDGEEYGQKPIKIPDNHYYLLGDNRGGAIDSRHFGSVSKKDIIGKVVKIIEGKREAY